MRVVADRALTHSSEHYRHGQGDLGRQLFFMRPFPSRSIFTGLAPRKTLVSIGSHKRSTDGFATWEAFNRIFSKYTG